MVSGLEGLKISSLNCSTEAVRKLYEALGNLKMINLNLYHLDEAFISLLDPSSPLCTSAPTTSTSTSTTSSNPATPGASSSSAAAVGPATTTPKIYLPSLESLSTRGLPGPPLRTLINARKSSGYPIKRLLVDMEDVIDSEDEKWLRGNVEEFAWFEGSDDEDEEVEEVEVLSIDEDEDEEDGEDGEDDDMADIPIEEEGDEEWEDEDEEDEDGRDLLNDVESVD